MNKEQADKISMGCVSTTCRGWLTPTMFTNLCENISAALLTAHSVPKDHVRGSDGVDVRCEEYVMHWMQQNYALCCEIARLEHEIASLKKTGKLDGTERGPYASMLLNQAVPVSAASPDQQAAEAARKGEA